MIFVPRMDYVILPKRLWIHQAVFLTNMMLGLLQNM